jgi:hypothetical protein
MAGEATPEERIEISNLVLRTLESMDLNEREQMSVLALLILQFWTKNKISVELFDTAMKRTRTEILNVLKDTVKPS